MEVFIAIIFIAIILIIGLAGIIGSLYSGLRKMDYIINVLDDMDKKLRTVINNTKENQ